MNPGVYLDMPGSEFAAIPALSASFLRDMLATTPAKAKALKEQGRPDSPAKSFGRQLHCCVLEPERFEREIAVMPEFKGKGARSLQAEWELRNAGRIQVKPKVLEQLLAMRDAVMKHPKAREMFAANGANEVSAVWDDPLGMRCKVRWDRIYSEWNLSQLDLKSTRNAEEGFFRYDVKQYGYDVEACLYSRALDVLHGAMHRPFYFIACEKIAPFRVEIYELTRSERILGNQRMEVAMRAYAESVRSGIWSDRPLFSVEQSSEAKESPVQISRVS